MHKNAITALAVATGAGLAYLLGTKRGQELLQQAKTTMAELPERFHRQPDTARMVEQALKDSRPDTAMAHAFEEAGVI